MRQNALEIREWYLLKMIFLPDRNKNVIFGFSVKLSIEIIPSLVSVN